AGAGLAAVGFFAAFLAAVVGFDVFGALAIGDSAVGDLAFAAVFLPAFFADFPAAFLAGFFADFLVVFLAFFAARFFVAALPAARLAAFPVFFFFEGFLATAKILWSIRTNGWNGLLQRLPRRFRKHREHRENQRFSLKIVVLGVACGAGDLFPYLRQPRKTWQVRIGGAVDAQPLGNPAVDAVDKGGERRPVRKSHGIAERMQLAGIDPRQGGEQGGRTLLKFQRVAAKQRQRARHAALRCGGRFVEGRIVTVARNRLRGGADHILGRKRAQRQFAAAGLDGRQHPRWSVGDQQEQRLLRRLLEDFQECIRRVRIELVDGIDDADPPALHRRGRAEERDGLARFVDRDHRPQHTLV